MTVRPGRPGGFQCARPASNLALCSSNNLPSQRLRDRQIYCPGRLGGPGRMQSRHRVTFLEKVFLIVMKRCTISRMQDTNKSWGGARPGSGKKPKVAGAPATSPITIKLTEAQKEKYQRLGGAPWVRDKIDKAKEPTQKE